MITQRSSDTLVGALVLSALVTLIVAFVLTKGWNRRQFDIYMWATSAQDLNSDTRVTLQALPVGNVTAVVPRYDASSGALRFLVRLRINERFQDGTDLTLPQGVTAEITSGGNVLGGSVVALRLPERPVGRMLPGDTISSIRRASPLDAIAQTADSLQRQLSLVLEDSRRLIDNLNGTVVLAQTELRRTAPEIRGTLTGVREALAALTPALSRADTLMADARGRLGSLHDSVSTTLAETRSLVTHLDSLAQTASAIAGENRDDLRTMVTNLYVLSAKLEYFLDQVSRRPLRMITGVRPPPSESLAPRP
ncbi:MAG: MlaD family protein [Gemmatimonadales bacterium]